MRKVVTLSATEDSEARSASAAAGMAGRKRSVANDPSVHRPPKMRMMSARRRGLKAPNGVEVARSHGHGCGVEGREYALPVREARPASERTAAVG